MIDISLLIQPHSCKAEPTPNPIALSNCPTVQTSGSKDHIFNLNISSTDKCIGIFDGDGPIAKEYAKTAGSFIMESIQDEWCKIRKNILEDDQEKVNSILKGLFEMTDEYLDIRLSNEPGGVSGLIIIIVDGQHTVVANVGNVSCLLFNDENITHLWGEHLADNIDEWELYCKRIPASKRKQFIYNKINIKDTDGNPLGPVINTNKYKTKPIPIFEYKNKTAGVIKDNVALMCSTSIPLGGSETVRRHLISGDDEMTVEPGYEHRNTGATVDGKIKLTRTMGHFKIKKACYLGTEPSIFYTKITSASVFVLGTDGFFDLWNYEDIPQYLTGVSSNIVQTLYNKTMEHAVSEGYKIFNNRFPVWDDITYAVIKMDDVHRVVESRVVNDTTEEGNDASEVSKKKKHKRQKNKKTRRLGRRRRKRRKNARR